MVTVHNAIKSVFSLTQETGNIWTQIFACVYVSRQWYRLGTATGVYDIWMLSLLLSAFTSACAHTFQSVSKFAEVTWFSLDYFMINLQLVAHMFPFTIAFCDDIDETIVQCWMLACVMTAIISTQQMLSTLHSTNTTNRVIPLACVWLLVYVPCHIWWIYNTSELLQWFYTFTIFGVMTYTYNIPNKWLKWRCFEIYSGHSMMHTFTLVGHMFLMTLVEQRISDAVVVPLFVTALIETIMISIYSIGACIMMLWLIYFYWAVSGIWNFKSMSASACKLSYECVDRYWKPIVRNVNPWHGRKFGYMDSLWYFFFITLNFQLNNGLRMIRFFVDGVDLNPEHNVHEMYYVVMNTSTFMWLDSVDHNIHLYDICLPSGRRRPFGLGSTGHKHISHMRITLDHETERVLSVTLDTETTTNLAEMAALIFIQGVAVGHVHTHVIAAQLDPLQCSWPLADKCSRAINGLNIAVTHNSGALLVSSDLSQMTQNNIKQGIPHSFAYGNSALLEDKSQLYRVLRAAHAHPKLIGVCSNHLQRAALIANLVTHPIDHYVIHDKFPDYLDSTLLDTNFWMVRFFSASQNTDIVTSFSEPWDEIGQIVLELITCHAPDLVPCFRMMPTT